MNFIEKLEKKLFILHITVKTNSKRQKIINNDRFLTISVKSKPVRNKANNELIRLLKNKLKIASNQIKIIAGMKSKDKIIQIHLLEEGGFQLITNRLLNH